MLPCGLFIEVFILRDMYYALFIREIPVFFYYGLAPTGFLASSTVSARTQPLHVCEAQLLSFPSLRCYIMISSRPPLVCLGGESFFFALLHVRDTSRFPAGWFSASVAHPRHTKLSVSTSCSPILEPSGSPTHSSLMRLAHWLGIFS